METKMKEPQYRPQVEIDLEGLKEGVATIASGIKKLFTPKTAEKSTTVHATPTTYLYGHSVSEQEVSLLKNKLTSFYGQSRVYGVDAKEIYDTIKDDLVLVLTPYVDAFDGTTFEEILKYAMDLSRRANNPIIKGIDALPGLDNLLKTDLIDSDTFGVQRISLAIIWSALITALFTKWTIVTDGEKKRIIKGGIALSLSVGVAFIQFCHKSPESVTNYLRMLYEGYTNVRDRYNMHHSKQIPDILKIGNPRSDFAKMTGQEKITIGQILNMVYTFRVGDMALSVLENKSKNFGISDDICKELISSVIPAPTQSETNKIYRLYTEDHIYNIY